MWKITRFPSNKINKAEIDENIHKGMRPFIIDDSSSSNSKILLSANVSSFEN